MITYLYDDMKSIAIIGAYVFGKGINLHKQTDHTTTKILMTILVIGDAIRIEMQYTLMIRDCNE